MSEYDPNEPGFDPGPCYCPRCDEPAEDCECDEDPRWDIDDRVDESDGGGRIDFANPGDPPSGRVTGAWAELGQALRHYRIDDRGWSKNHTPERVLREVRGSGITVSIP